MAKRKKRPKLKLVSVRDVGTPERRQHGGDLQLEQAADLGISRVRVQQQTPLDRYRARNQLHDLQYQAGEQFSKHWHEAAKGQRVIGSYADRRQGGEDAAQHPHVAYNAEDVKSAIDALDYVGNECSGVVISVCGLHESAGNWAKANDRPRHEGLVTLRLALNILARHFGLMQMRKV